MCYLCLRPLTWNYPNRERSFTRTSCWTDLPEGLQAAARRIKFRKPAAFLFNQIIFPSAAALGRVENTLPIRGSLPQQNLVTFLWFRRPILEMKRANSPRIRANPGYWIGAGLQASAHIQLQHDGRFRIFRQDFHRALAVNRRELQPVIVISGFQSGSFQLIGSGIQRIGHRLPAIQAGLRFRRSHDYVFAAQNQVEVARFADFLRTEIRTVVVRREASNTEIVQKLPHLIGLRFRPLEIGRIEFNALVSHFRDGANRALGVFFEFLAHRIEFQSGGDRFRRASRKRPRQHRRKSNKRPPRKRVWGHKRILMPSRILTKTQSACDISFTASRPGTRLRTITYRTGMKTRISVIAAIIPPKTVAPTEMRPARPAPCASTSGTTPRMNASEVPSPRLHVPGRLRPQAANVAPGRRQSDPGLSPGTPRGRA